MLRIENGQLVSGQEMVPPDQIKGFIERFDRWRGQIHIEIVGGANIGRFGEGYSSFRRELRQLYPDKPFASEWVVRGYPPAFSPWLRLLAASVWWLGAVIVAAEYGFWAGGLWLLFGLWPIIRLGDRVLVTGRGVRVGPPWAPLIRWEQLSEIHVERVSPHCAVTRFTSSNGMWEADVPALLLPAFCGHLERIGGLPVDNAREVEHHQRRSWRYQRWVRAASGIPWGVWVASIFVAPWTATPWTVIQGGMWTAAALAALSAAVEARATGWNFGGVFWATICYAAVLAAWSLSGTIG